MMATYTVGGKTYEVIGGDAGNYNTQVYDITNGGRQLVTGNGTQPVSLQMSAALSDPRFSSWLSTDDPSIKYDDLMRATWAIDPTQALEVYGQQAARKPGGVDQTPDTAWFTDQSYWPTVMSGFDGSYSALNQAVKQLGTSTPQTESALSQWRNDMSPGAQSARNDPDTGLFGLGDFGNILGLAALAWGIPTGLEALGLTGAGASGAGLAMGADAVAGIPAWDSAFASALGTGAAGAAGANSMGLESDLLSLLDGPAGGGGSTSDWWSQALSQSSNYSLGDLFNTVSGVSNSLPNGTSNVLNSLFGGSGNTNGLTTGGSLLSSALGGLLGLTNGSSQTGTYNVTQTPWSSQQPYLQDLFSKAQAQNNSTSPMQTQANINYNSLLGGATSNPYMGDNPYLQSMIDKANNDTSRAMMPAYHQAQMASGSFGNSGVEDTWSKNMADAYSNNANTMRYQNYNNSANLAENAVNRTTAATTGASTFANQPLTDYKNLISGSYGGTQSSPIYGNNTLNALGGASAGYNLYKSLFGG